MFFSVSTLIFSDIVNISKREVDCIKNSGFDFIEISSFHCVSSEVLDYINARGMKICSTHSNFLQTDISSSDEVLRSHSIQVLKGNILTAKRLGADVIVVHPGGWSIDKSILDFKISTVIRSCTEITEFASRNDIKIAIENLPPEFMCDNIEDMQSILGGVRDNISCRDSIGVCLDTGHANLSNILPEFITEFGKDIITMHIHDNEGYMGGSRLKAEDDLHNIPGLGKIDWENVFNKIHKSGYDNVLVLELNASHSSEKNIGKILIKAREFLDKL